MKSRGLGDVYKRQEVELQPLSGAARDAAVQGEPSEKDLIVPNIMSPVSGELSQQGHVLFQTELSVFKCSKEGPGEGSPKVFRGVCWCGKFIPQNILVSAVTTLGCCI